MIWFFSVRIQLQYTNEWIFSGSGNIRWRRSAETSPTTPTTEDDDDDWEEEESSEIDDDGKIYKNPRNSPSTLCPRDEEQATLLVSETFHSFDERYWNGTIKKFILKLSTRVEFFSGIINLSSGTFGLKDIDIGTWETFRGKVEELIYGTLSKILNRTLSKYINLFQGQKCLRKCSSDEDCKSKKKKCLCDGACGMSCIKPG